MKCTFSLEEEQWSLPLVRCSTLRSNHFCFPAFAGTSITTAAHEGLTPFPLTEYQGVIAFNDDHCIQVSFAYCPYTFPGPNSTSEISNFVVCPLTNAYVWKRRRLTDRKISTYDILFFYDRLFRLIWPNMYVASWLLVKWTIFGQRLKQ